MGVESVVDTIVAKLEEPDKHGLSLADKLRRSRNPKWGSWDGSLVSEMAKVIDEVLDQMPEEELRHAWNELAEMEGCDPLAKGEILGGPYSDMFINPVLDVISRRD